MGTFSFSTSVDTMGISIAGDFDVPTAAEFVKRFKSEISRIQPVNYNLTIEVSQMKVQTTDMQSVLKQCFELYESAGFKKIKMNVGGNAVLAMQARRLAKEASLSNVEVH